MIDRSRAGRYVAAIAAALLPSLLWGQAAAPQSADAFTLRTYMRLTLVDVTAVDGKGNPVHGLPESAFTVLEDGKPQPIRSFMEYGKETPLVTRQLPKLPPYIYTNLQPPVASSSVNVLLLDALNTRPQDQIFVKQETVNYIKNMPPGTRVAIMLLGSSLRLVQGFTSDSEVLMAAVKTKKNRALPSPFSDTDSNEAFNSELDVAGADAMTAIQEFQNEQLAFQADIRNRMTLEALNQIAAYLAGIKGRKNLIWLTDGMPLQMFPQGGADDLATMSDYTLDMRKTTDMLTAAQVAVYPVDARGVTTNPAGSVVHPLTGFANGRGDAAAKATTAFEMGNAQSHLGMEAVADATGGVAYFNTNGLKEAVGKAVANGSDYYTLSYVPPSTMYDGAFHRITVKVNMQGVHLAYREGYFADDVARNEIKPGITLATKAPEPYGSNMSASMGRGVPTSSQLLFTVRVQPQGDQMNPAGTKTVGTLDPKLQNKPLRRYDIQYSLPGQQIVFTQNADKTHQGGLEFDIAAYDVYGKLITSLSQSIDLKLTDDRYQKLQKSPFQLEQAVDLPEGEIFLRLGVLDTVSDKTGTLEIPLDVNNKPVAKPAAANAAPQP